MVVCTEATVKEATKRSTLKALKSVLKKKKYFNHLLLALLILELHQPTGGDSEQ